MTFSYRCYSVRRIIILFLLFQRHVSALLANNVAEYECPAVGSSPVPVVVNVGSGTTTVGIKIVAPGTLCTLTRVSPRSAQTSVTSYSSDKLQQDWNIVPVARSTRVYPWENVAGPYVTSLVIESCDTLRCIMRIPNLAQGINAMFVLTTFVRDISDQEKVARFLEQVTFGPTRGDMDKFNSSKSPLPNQFFQYVVDQMNPNVTKPTYHREFFRERVSYPIVQAKTNGFFFPAHPCDAGSRWRKHSFSWSDNFDRTITATKTSSGKVLLFVDGVPRTVIDSFQVTLLNGTVQTWPLDEQYVIADYHLGTYVGGRVAISRKSTIDGALLRDGNPPINLPTEILRAFNTSIKTLALPDQVYFTKVNEMPLRFQYPSNVGFAAYRANVSIADPSCYTLSKKIDYSNIIGILPNGEQWYYDAKIRLRNNTLMNPILENTLAIPGSSITESIFNSGITFCPNVARTFLNADQCVLRTDGDSFCSTTRVNTRIFLNETTIRMLFQGSGRYVYTIRSLQLNQTYSPCKPYMRHRWMKIANSYPCETTGISNSTINALLSMWNDWGLADQNSVYADLHNEWHGARYNETGIYKGYTCDYSNQKTIGMRLSVSGVCWQHVHPDEGNVYDFTYWTRVDTHPGNAIAQSSGKPNPIKKIVDSDNATTLYFPVSHTMDRWENNKVNFDFIGRSFDSVEYLDLPTVFQSKGVSDLFNPSGSALQAALVCGSRGEVANNLYYDNIFANTGTEGKQWNILMTQKGNVWSMVAMSAPDQLRQRMAWALSQVLVVSEKRFFLDPPWVPQSEPYLNYYDIFIHHAFGNYRDILKEVSMSPMMAEMLSFLRSKSSDYVFTSSRSRARPDENFAREIMQLFSIGVYQLNIDGTLKLSDQGLPIPTYDNIDIQTFARAWTGFSRQPLRGNVEAMSMYAYNHIDPMVINPRWRDVFPKKNLYDRYIGDAYPLCGDLPKQQFLNIGAKYILLGSSSFPEYHTGDEYFQNDPFLTRLSLNQTSQLYQVLCNPGADGRCRYKSTITLNRTLSCTGVECFVDTIRTVRVSNSLPSISPLIYYEYIRPPCVELSFYNGGKNMKLNEGGDVGEYVICANPAADFAQDSCCRTGSSESSMFCRYSGERVLYATAQNRCKMNDSNSDVCESVSNVNSYTSNPGCNRNEYSRFHWTKQNCAVNVIVEATGTIAIIHDSLSNQKVKFAFSSENDMNFFPITWDTDVYPSVGNNCGYASCSVVNGTKCLCSLNVEEKAVFFSVPNKSSVLSQLFIGSAPPTWFRSEYSLTESVGGINVYQRNGANYDMNTIFGVLDGSGGMKYFRNKRSTVVIGNGTFRFRNPPHFVSFIVPDARDVMYETDAVIDHYFYHPNTAPFLSQRIIQRFGISNPSPRYVKTVAMAFKTGFYNASLGVIGDGRYGNLGAMLAAVVLDREARSVILDSDPSYGSLREPLIKLIAFMRAMQFRLSANVTEIRFQGLSSLIGQSPHEAPSVFSFFSPDYSPAGLIKNAAIASPEAQVTTSPKIIGFLNGMISLVDFGLSSAWYGFGLEVWLFLPNAESEGTLRYEPRSNIPKDISDELALLLTSGRLSSESRRFIAGTIENATSLSDGIRTAQKLIITSPEFHSTSIISAAPVERANMMTPTQSKNAYKAIVFVNLGGGLDSYNVLVPHSGCVGGKDLYSEYKFVRGEVALQHIELLVINATSSQQMCKTYGLHPDLSNTQKLYGDGNLAFLANVGVLQEYANKTDYIQKHTRTALFAHNGQSAEISLVDVFREKGGYGVCGRMADTLAAFGFNVNLVSLMGEPQVLVSKATPVTMVDPNNFYKVNPRPEADDIVPKLKRLNKSNKVGSSLFGETWSQLLTNAIGENDILYNSMVNTKIDTTFPNTQLGNQLKAVAKLVRNQIERRSDRDIFHVGLDGFDSHSDLKKSLQINLQQLDGALGAFAIEMKVQNRWNDVVILFASEFARTLTPNTSGGTDHAWGGNYFIAGGSVKGGKIYGKYITDFTDNSPINFPPGIVIPTTSWDQVWEAIATWYGVTTPGGLDEVIPNRGRFSGPVNGIF